MKTETVVIQTVTVQIGPGFVLDFVEISSPSFACSVAQSVSLWRSKSL